MTTTTRQDSRLAEPASNEAAERLRSYLNATATVRGIAFYRRQALADFDEALAAERRATVEHLWALIDRLPFSNEVEIAYRAKVRAILDEEAAR